MPNAGIQCGRLGELEADVFGSNRHQSCSEKRATAEVNASVHKRSRRSLRMNAATAAAASGLKINTLSKWRFRLGWEWSSCEGVGIQEESDDQDGGHREGKSQVLLHLAALGKAEPAPDAPDAFGEAIHHAINDLIIEQAGHAGITMSGTSPATR